MEAVQRKAVWWIVALVSGLIVFIFVNFFVWFYGINLLFLPYPNCGDLARIGFAPEISQCREEAFTLPRRMHEWKKGDTTRFSVLSFGDSISRGRGGGRNNYWQDHFATEHNTSISWVSEVHDNNYVQDVVLLRNSGFLKKYGVKHLVMQAAERAAVNRLTSPSVDWNMAWPLSDLEDKLDSLRGMLYTDNRHIEAWIGQKLIRYGGDRDLLNRALLEQFLFMHATPVILWFDRMKERIHSWQGIPLCNSPRYNRLLDVIGMPPCTRLLPLKFRVSDIVAKYPSMQGLPWDAQSAPLSDGARTQMSAAINNNFKWLISWAGHKLGVFDKTETAQRRVLTRDLFSGNYPKQLIFHLGDLKSNKKNLRKGGIEGMHASLNRLADMLKQDGITLYFMPSPNKLTAYQAYLAEPVDQNSEFFPRLRALNDKRYGFIDTLAVVESMVSREEKDIYFVDDTHWSEKPLPEIVKLFPPNSFN